MGTRRLRHEWRAGDAYTDAAVRASRRCRRRTGNWSANESRRPPMNAGDFQAAAVCIYAIKHYTPRRRGGRDRTRDRTAVRWLEECQSRDDTGSCVSGAWRLRGRSKVRRRASEGRAHRYTRCSAPTAAGASCHGLESDAYATGQALYALSVAGRVARPIAVYQKGIDYLLRTQARGRHLACEIALDLAAAVLREWLSVRTGSVHFSGRNGVGVDGAQHKRSAAGKHAALTDRRQKI